MRRCAQCGFEMAGDVELCPHHDVREHGWAASNRVMCDFVHRGKTPPRLSPEERADELIVSCA